MPTRQQIKLSGELYVASELSRRGFNVGLTIGNVEYVDLLVERNGNALSIQVKSIRRRRNNSFQITNDQIIDDYWYFFVNIQSETLEQYECIRPTNSVFTSFFLLPTFAKKLYATQKIISVSHA